jgi:hypothetical protein
MGNTNMTGTIKRKGPGMADEMDEKAVALLARRLYLHYAAEKKWDPYPAPWAPRWAMDYARIAVDSYGYDEQALDELRQELSGVAA